MQRPGSLSCGTSVCLSTHPSLKPLRSRQEAQPSSAKLPLLAPLLQGLFLRLPEIDGDGQGDASTWERC